VVPFEELSVDELIDCLIPLMLEGVVRGEDALPVVQKIKDIGGKPIHFIGQRKSGEWDEIRPGCTYTGLRAGVRLANRNSALNELEYSELVMRLRSVADQLEAEIDVPEMSVIVVAARELHRFLTAHDALLSVNVIPRSLPWDWSDLIEALQAQGFEPHGEGKFKMPDGDGEEMENGWEGCLSVPGLRGLVPRYTKLRYTGVDQFGKEIDRTVEGFHARVVQHECDHLWGILYPMRIEDMAQFGFEEVLGRTPTRE
jgi:hypothetical protein